MATRQSKEVTLIQPIKKLSIRDVVMYADKQIEAIKEVVQKGSKSWLMVGKISLLVLNILMVNILQ